jgi:hypothetical protein
VADEGVELLEAAGVEELGDPLAGGVLALAVLLVDPRAVRVGGLGAELLEVGDLLVEGLRRLLAELARRAATPRGGPPIAGRRGDGEPRLGRRGRC